MEKHSEFIAVVDADFTWNMTGQLHTDQDDIKRRFQSIDGHLSFRRRRELDVGNSRLPFLQLLPYLVLSLKVDSPSPETGSTVKKFFVYQRTKKIGEQRLEGKLSLGVGGHIDISDVVLTHGSVVATPATLIKALQRETTEEVIGDGVPIVPTDSHLPSAIIADNSDDVGRHHLGLVKELSCYSDDVKCAEAELVTIGFLTIQELTERYVHFESWSRILIDALIENEEVLCGTAAAS